MNSALCLGYWLEEILSQDSFVNFNSLLRLVPFLVKYLDGHNSLSPLVFFFTYEALCRWNVRHFLRIFHFRVSSSIPFQKLRIVLFFLWMPCRYTVCMKIFLSRIQVSLRSSVVSSAAINKNKFLNFRDLFGLDLYITVYPSNRLPDTVILSCNFSLMPTEKTQGEQ